MNRQIGSNIYLFKRWGDKEKNNFLYKLPSTKSGYTFNHPLKKLSGSTKQSFISQEDHKYYSPNLFLTFLNQSKKCKDNKSLNITPSKTTKETVLSSYSSTKSLRTIQFNNTNKKLSSTKISFFKSTNTSLNKSSSTKHSQYPTIYTQKNLRTLILNKEIYSEKKHRSTKKISIYINSPSLSVVRRKHKRIYYKTNVNIFQLGKCAVEIGIKENNQLFIKVDCISKGKSYYIVIGKDSQIEKVKKLYVRYEDMVNKLMYLKNEDLVSFDEKIEGNLFSMEYMRTIKCVINHKGNDVKKEEKKEEIREREIVNVYAKVIKYNDNVGEQMCICK